MPSVKRKWDPGYFTVGWICAIRTEYVAAQAFLDDNYDRLEHVSRHDNNEYTLGRIGEHNVVMTVLPQGEYGIAAAAGVAKDMLRSFPSVRIGLMVGNGGGVPSAKHDIRLGDVVVSSAGNGRGGVYQYDYGKTIANHHFHPTGFLDQPPTFLRTAVRGLEAEYVLKGHQLKQAINGVLETNPRLQKDYHQPPRSSDRLFHRGIVHPENDESSCEGCCGRNGTNLVERTPRTEDDSPAIHYGLIASANSLMKDANVRDALAAEKDVLCFEMEAAGLMNHFPCLVIRGICDYADSHKNKEWQGYASMTAAAYAKDLLRRIPLHDFEAEKNGAVGHSQSLDDEQKKELLESLRFDQIDARQMTIKTALTRTCS